MAFKLGFKEVYGAAVFAATQLTEPPFSVSKKLLVRPRVHSYGVTFIRGVQAATVLTALTSLMPEQSGWQVLAWH